MLNNGTGSERAVVAGYVVIALFFILILRLWQIQLLQGEQYRKLSENNRLRIIRVPAPRGIIFDRQGTPLVRNKPFYSVALNNQSTGTLDLNALASLLKIEKDVLQEKIRGKLKNTFEPVRLKEGLTFREIAAIDSRRSDFPGLFIDVDVSREYLFGDVGAHLIGYLGKPNESQFNSHEFRDVPADAFIGQWGIERLYDRHLRGVPGERIIEVDAMGRELRLLKEVPPVRGENITLAMDVNLQKEGEKAFGDKTGALVALRPDTGEILALISRPSFDPNLFARGISARQWKELNENSRLPLLNRSLQSQYPPGSTFKIITALAALEEGVITPETTVTCNGGISYGRWHFGCWQKKGHGTVSFHRALVESCDVYFYEAGKRLGIDRLAEYARRFGLGKRIDLQLVSERQGLIPDTKWKEEKRNQPWYLGETFNASIGQGYVAATPFQMARLTATVINGGALLKPCLLKLNEKPEAVTTLPVKPETIEIIKKALYGVVNEAGGTGWSAHSALTTISGKTGTAQVVRGRKDSKHLPAAFRDHAWFVAFAPLESAPSDTGIALAVMVEHGGHGGAAAAPIAKAAIEAYTKSVQAAKPQLTARDYGQQ